MPKRKVLNQEANRRVPPKTFVPPVDNGPGDWTIHWELPNTQVSDARPDPKPRKHPQLWQAYLFWNEFMELRKRHVLRISSIERGKSNLDAIYEQTVMDQIGIDPVLDNLKKNMVICGKVVPVWDWVTNIKGMKQGGLAAQLLAQIDDITKFDTVASLWRFAGFAVIDGKAEKNQKGEKSHYNRRLKGVCYNIADQFIRQQTPGYVEIYYAEKERQRGLYPDVYCKQCSFDSMQKNRTKKELAEVIYWDDKVNHSGMTVSTINDQLYKYSVKWEDCPTKKSHTKTMTDAHVHNRAWRKMIKAFLRDLWVEWNQVAGTAQVINV